MINSWEELGDHLAEIENRFSYLENSQPCYREPEVREAETPHFTQVIYQINAKSTPAFKELDQKIHLLNGRLTKYFGGKKKEEAPF